MRETGPVFVMIGGVLATAVVCMGLGWRKDRRVCGVSKNLSVALILPTGRQCDPVSTVVMAVEPKATVATEIQHKLY